MTKDKKKPVYIALAVLLFMAAVAGTIMVLKLSHNNTSNGQQTTVLAPSTTSTKAQAAALQAQASQATKNNETDKAKQLLEKALQQYKDLNDTKDVNKINAQLHLINNTSSTPPAKIIPIGVTSH